MKIKQLKNFLIISLASLSIVVTAFNSVSLAADEPIQNPTSTAKKTSFDFLCPGSGNRTTTENVSVGCLTRTVLQFLSITVGIAVVGGITTGGIMYASSGGNPSRAAQGRNIILNSLLGLVLFFLMFAFINFLVPGGILR